MTSGRQSSSTTPRTAGELFCHSTDLNDGTFNTALYTLLLLYGAVQPSDAILVRTTEAELAMARSALSLLANSEATNAA